MRISISICIMLLMLSTGISLSEVSRVSAAEPSTLSGAGVTIITHGWNPVAGQPAWLEAMQNAVLAKYTGETGHAAKITVTGSKGNLQVSCTPWEFDWHNSRSGEIVVVVDWSAVANHLTSGITAQEVAAVIAPKIYQSENGQPPLAELPIHLIGHSRGGGMVYELARLLGEQGVAVEQVTSLDPHPLTTADSQSLFLGNTIDTPVNVYDNILFCDNYYQEIAYPKGQYVNGAYNRLWTLLPGGYHNSDSLYRTFADHLNIILMYYATIDLAAPASNGEASLESGDRSDWFNAYEANGEKTGVYYSLFNRPDQRKSAECPVAGGDSVIAGYHDNALLGGAGQRQAVNCSNAVWPNIITVDILRGDEVLGSGMQIVTPGEELLISYTYRDYDSNSTCTLYLDRDRNPYNNNDLVTLGTQSLTATAANIIKSTAQWTVSEISPDENYFLYAKLTDGDRTRYVYAVPSFKEQGEQIDECFIATACFNSKFHPAVVLLRHFRDQYLLTNTPGKAFVASYYRNSPAVAHYLSQHDSLKMIVRIALIPVIFIAFLMLNPSLIGLLTVMVLLIAGILIGKKLKGQFASS